VRIKHAKRESIKGKQEMIKNEKKETKREEEEKGEEGLIELVALLQLINLGLCRNSHSHVSVVDLFSSHDGIEDDVPASEERLTGREDKEGGGRKRRKRRGGCRSEVRSFRFSLAC